MPFVKGDPRINRKGRPKSFDQLRALAQMIANEQGAIDEEGKPHTNAEMALRKLMKEDAVKFLEIAYGKVPQNIEMKLDNKLKIEAYDYHDAIAALAPRPVDDSRPPGEGESAGDGAQVGQDDDDG